MNLKKNSRLQYQRQFMVAVTIVNRFFPLWLPSHLLSVVLLEKRFGCDNLHCDVEAPVPIPHPIERYQSNSATTIHTGTRRRNAGDVPISIMPESVYSTSNKAVVVSSCRHQPPVKLRHCHPSDDDTESFTTVSELTIRVFQKSVSERICPSSSLD